MSTSRADSPQVRKMPNSKPLRPPVIENVSPEPAASIAGVSSRANPKQPGTTGVGVGHHSEGAGASSKGTNGGVGGGSSKMHEKEKLAPQTKSEAGVSAVEYAALSYNGKIYRLGIKVEDYKKSLQKAGFLPSEPEPQPEVEATDQKDTPVAVSVAETKSKSKPQPMKELEPPAAVTPGARVARGMDSDTKPTAAAAADLNGKVVETAGSVGTAPDLDEGVMLTYGGKKFFFPIPPETYKNCLQQAGLI